ncbi:hypothetical protein [Salmonella phage SSBI34]|nr:hypothetical protein [Salmonella phage SSBI34]
MTSNCNTTNLKEETLDRIGDLLAKINIDAQIRAAIETIDFLKGIHRPTKQNKKDLEKLEEGLQVLAGEEFKDAIKNTFKEHYGKLSADDLDRYLKDLEYEARIAEASLTLSPALTQLNESFFGPKE